MREIADAIASRQVITFEYEGKPRMVEPHIVGANQKGHALMRGYQIGGDSNGALPNWRLFDLTKVNNVEVSNASFTPRFTEGYKYNDRDFTMVAAAVSKMKVYYAVKDISNVAGPSIFLCGPTPRAAHVLSWRPEALRVLDALGFEGSVFVPEGADWSKRETYDDQVEWEWNGIDQATVVAFWVPREIADMPAFTTNVEFGLIAERMMWHNSAMMNGWSYTPQACVLGFPPRAPKMTYLERLAGRAGIEVKSTLEQTMQAAIDHAKEIA